MSDTVLGPYAVPERKGIIPTLLELTSWGVDSQETSKQMCIIWIYEGNKHDTVVENKGDG